MTHSLVPVLKEVRVIEQSDLATAIKFPAKGKTTFSKKIEALQAIWHLDYTLKDEKS